MVIMGYRIPKGVPLMFAPLPMHLSPFNFSHPDKFWPDRWSAGVVADWDPKHSGSCLSCDHEQSCHMSLVTSFRDSQ